jgi:cell division protein YceG involved in septum cleavage
MRKTIKRLVLAMLVAMLLGVVWMAYYAYTPLKVASLPAEFTLKHGSSLKSVSKQLTERHPAATLLQDQSRRFHPERNHVYRRLELQAVP